MSYQHKHQGAWRLEAVLLSLLVAAAAPALTQPTARTMAVTVDDLPCSSCGRFGGWREVTDQLLAALKEGEVPAIGFVNEIKLELEGTPANEAHGSRIALLEAWLDAGFELGNHSYSHPDLHHTPVSAFQADVLLGEKVTNRLLRARDLPEARYFRHPYLHTGRDRETKEAMTAFFDQHGYQIAPVTIDNSEWIFARAYDVAHAAEDRDSAVRVIEAYISYMRAKTQYFERLSEALLGYQLPQILLIHANRLNALAFGPLAESYRELGYRFVPLGEALKDLAYSREDTYYGPAGMSWLERWAIAEDRGRDLFSQDPPTPRWVLDLAGIDSE